MIKLKMFNLFAIALMIGAIAWGTQSCSKDEPGDVQVTGITVAPESTTLAIGGTVTLVATVSPADATNKGVIWTSSNTSVATVNDNGLVTAVAAGEANIVVTSKGNSAKSATCVVTCTSDDPIEVQVTDIAIEPQTATLTVGGTVTLVATVSPADATDKGVTWTSSNTSVATVGANGLVTAVAAGEANIVVTSVGNSEKTATCVVTVNEEFSVSLNRSSRQIAVGATCTLIAEITPTTDNPPSIVWGSDNADVATIVDGVVTGHSVGTATISVTLLDNGATAECIVTVAAAVAVPDPLGVWTFEDETNIRKATVGEDLNVSGTFTSIDGPNGTKGVAADESAYFQIRHNIGANGGGEYTNEYTLMMDIRGSQEGFDGWLTVFDAGTGDGSRLWINGNGQIGFETFGGYSETGLRPDTWHRVIIAAKLGDSFKVYIDGELVWTASQGTEVDEGLSLETEAVYIGYDTYDAPGDGYPCPDFAEVRMWNVQLTDEEVLTLGQP
jgi:uncharacterized protein YjdB